MPQKIIIIIIIIIIINDSIIAIFCIKIPELISFDLNKIWACPVISYNQQLENGELHVTYFFAFFQRQAKTKSRVGVV